jgi:hypothetical protein
MASARSALRLVADAVWYLAWTSLALGALLLLLGRKPSPGSEWNAAAAGALLLIPIGVIGLVLGGLLRRTFRRREGQDSADPAATGAGGSRPRRFVRDED